MEYPQAVEHAASPRISARPRERCTVAAVHDDRFDVIVVADTLRQGHRRWRVLPVLSPVLAEIKAVIRDRDRLLESQKASEHQVRMVSGAYPAPARFFSSIDRRITFIHRRACCLSVRRSAPARSIRRMPESGSPVRGRCPQVPSSARWRHRSRMSPD